MRDGEGIDELSDVLINVLTSEVVGIGIGALVGVEIIVLVSSARIDLGFAVSVSYAVVDVIVGVWLDQLTDVCSDDVTIVTASGIGLDMFADVVTNVLTDSVPFC